MCIRDRLLLAGQAHQLLAVLGQHVVGAFGVVAGHALVAPHLGQHVQKFAFVNGELAQHLAHGGVGRVHQAQGQMLHGHVFVLHVPGGLFRRGQGFVQLRGDVDFVRVPAGARHMGQLGHLVCKGGGQVARLDAHLAEQLADEAVLLI